MNCKECGNILNPNDKICSKCGTPVNNNIEEKKDKESVWTTKQEEPTNIPQKDAFDSWGDDLSTKNTGRIPIITKEQIKQPVTPTEPVQNKPNEPLSNIPLVANALAEKEIKVSQVDPENFKYRKRNKIGVILFGVVVLAILVFMVYWLIK